MAKVHSMRWSRRSETEDVQQDVGLISHSTFKLMGFRQFLLRGLRKAKGEWTPACLAWNLKCMAVLRQKSVQWP